MKIGFVGAGNIARAHMETFARLQEESSEEGMVELAGLADIDPAAAAACAEKFGIGRVYRSAEELIAGNDIEALVIAVPNRWHAPFAVAALEAGKHVLLEKPMGVGLAAARQIYETQQRTGHTLMIAHQFRWCWWAKAMEERCRAGSLGEIYHARTGWMRRKGIPAWGTWFTQKEISGGGPLIDLGVHMLDVALHLMGNPRPVRVSGLTTAKFGPKQKGIGRWGTPDFDGTFDVEDFATALVRLEGGRTLSLDVSWAAHVDRPKEYVELLGEEAGLSYDGDKLKMLTEREGETHDEVIGPPATDERYEMTLEFLAAIRAGRQPACHAYSGLVNNSILDAIYRSSELGCEVEIELPDAPAI